MLDLATMTTRNADFLNSPPPAAAAGAEAAAAGRASGRGGGGGGARAIVVGNKTDSVFFTKTDPTTRVNSVYKADTNTGQVTKLIDLPPRVSISSVNADETLGAGTYNEADCPGGDPNAPNAFLPAQTGGFWRVVDAVEPVVERRPPQRPQPDPAERQMLTPQIPSWVAPTCSPTIKAR